MIYYPTKLKEEVVEFLSEANYSASQLVEAADLIEDRYMACFDENESNKIFEMLEKVSDRYMIYIGTVSRLLSINRADELMQMVEKQYENIWKARALDSDLVFYLYKCENAEAEQIQKIVDNEYEKTELELIEGTFDPDTFIFKDRINNALKELNGEKISETNDIQRDEVVVKKLTNPVISDEDLPF